ncbi:aminoglycoside phosphotransferase family protein, partial [Glycomyces algeriensis]
MSDWAIDEYLLCELLEEQHPDLAGLELKSVDGGWSNQMWRLGPDLAVRIPRHEGAPELLEREHRLVPGIAPRLPLPVPVPTRLGRLTERFPHTWLIATWVHGTPADIAPITDAESATVLAEFLTALHTDGPETPANDGRGAPLAAMDDHFEQALARHRGIDADRARAIWRGALEAPQRDQPDVWLHGDLHPANVVVDDGALAGVIDFGDVFVGDPAVDLAAAWILLPDGAAEPFFNAYKAAEESVVLRARGRALIKALVLLDIGVAGELGRPGGKPTWKPSGEAALAR